MRRVFRKKSLGKANYDWLTTYHHFSFAHYYNPARMGFGHLRVLNDDLIAANSGFDMHSHRDMEIISYVHQGAITHKDSAGNEGLTTAGNVQVITAGSGIMHSEYNLESTPTQMYQIWIRPREKNLNPAWAQAKLQHSQTNAMQLLVAGDGSAPLYINQDAKLYLGKLLAGNRLCHTLNGNAYLVVLDGEVSDGTKTLYKGDGLEIENEDEVCMAAQSSAEFLVIELGA